MTTRRIGLTQSMVLILALAAGLAAMRVAAVWIGQCVILGSTVALLVVTLGASVRRNRATWIGWALFGWAYLLLAVGLPVAIDSIAVSNIADDTNFPDIIDVWQIDGPMRALALRFHPEAAMPQPPDPFPGEPRLRGISNNGRRTKVVAGETVPFTPEDDKLQAEYEARVAYHETEVEAAGRARWIGLTLQGLVFAVVGGIVGNVLSDQSRNASESPEARAGLALPRPAPSAGRALPYEE